MTHKVTKIRVSIEQGAENWYELFGEPGEDPIACGAGAWAREHIDMNIMREVYEKLKEAIIE